MRGKELYFIALIPPEDLREEVKALKDEMKERYNTERAMRSPAHITLQMPFRRAQDDEPGLLEALTNFAILQDPFPVKLSCFGSFIPKVIFINVEDHRRINDLHAELNKSLIDHMAFETRETTKELHPHMTIATRDLNKANFHSAWTEFEERTFKASFEARSIFLLKHNGAYWEISRDFLFAS